MSSSSLKRPRSSNPPSPSTSSSSKRAMSEDPGGASFDSDRTEGISGVSSTTLQPEADVLTTEPDAGEWVQKTEDFHLGSDSRDSAAGEGMDVDEGETQDVWKKRYDELLVDMSPPFTVWSRYYLIPPSLVRGMKDIAFGESDSVPKIDLTPLLDDRQSKAHVISVVDGSPSSIQETIWQVKDGLVEDEDFTFISEAGWKKLCDWLAYDGPSLGRFCKDGDKIEMVPPLYTVHHTRPSSVETTDTPALTISCPTITPIPVIYRKLHDIFGLTLANPPTRLWSLQPDLDADLPTTINIPATTLARFSASKLGLDGSTTCAEAGLESGDYLVLEISKSTPLGPVWALGVSADGKATPLGMTVPTAPPPLFSKPAMYPGSGSDASSSKSGMQTRSQSKKSAKRGKGLIGLVNLGNTCFMNSAVQCLSNTPELKDYFLSGVYKNELNTDNPLGMGGAIAENFGMTIEQLWAASSSYGYSPRQLKYTTSRFAPQFAGYGQHDTQEFIAFLLDGLHEDLNRIQKKPYIEKPDWKPGGGDRELAELGKECWEGYKKRNDSVIVDLFQGQLRSTLVCPVCTKESITLDPFMYLTVPLPIAQTRVFSCHFVPLDPEKPPMQVKLLIPQNASFMQIKEKLASLVGCDARHIVGFDLWKSAVYKWFLDSEHNSECKDNDVPVFYELAVPVSASRKAVGYPATEDTVTVPVYSVQTGESHHRSNYHSPPEGISQPFFITLNKAEASDPVAVREAITRGYSRLIKPEMQSHMWAPSGSSKAAKALPHFTDEENVAEIHIDGDETRVVETSSSQESQVKRVGSCASLSTLASAKSGKLVPRGDLFKVHVADAGSSESSSSFTMFKGKDDTIPFFRGSSSSASTSWSLLENRRKAKKNMFGHLATGLKSIVGGSYASDDEASPSASPVGPPLVVRPGEGIFCEWSVKKSVEYFDRPTRLGEDVVDPAIAKEAAKRREGRSISIEDCLDEFSKEETLGQDDLWYCPQCKKHQAATKKLEIYQAPDILVICIKRFGSSRRLHDKLDNLVNFPIEGLDLTDRIGERTVAKNLGLSEEEAQSFGMQMTEDGIIYDLYAVDNHFGGLGGGHYTAFCKNPEDGQWYNYDDSRVSKASPDSVQSKAAYLLFYRRRTTRPIGGISRLKAEEASRAASPMISDSESDASDKPTTTTTDDPELPSYSSRDISTPPTPVPPSPTISSEGEAEMSDLDGRQSSDDQGAVDFGSVGTHIGFGNTAWGSEAPRRILVNTSHAFATDSAPPTTDHVPDILTPPDSDDFERMERSGLVDDEKSAGGNGSGNGFEMVEKAEEDADAEVGSSGDDGSGVKV